MQRVGEAGNAPKISTELMELGPKKLKVEVTVRNPKVDEGWWYGVGFSRFAVMVRGEKENVFF